MNPDDKGPICLFIVHISKAILGMGVHWCSWQLSDVTCTFLKMLLMQNNTGCLGFREICAAK